MAAKRWSREEEVALIKAINGGGSLKDLAPKFDRTELALEMRLKKIVYENINMGRSPVQIAGALKLPEDTINKYYYGFKEHLERHDKKDSHGDSDPAIKDVVAKIDNNLHSAPSMKIQTGGDLQAKQLQKFEEENKLLKAIIENKQLKNYISRMAKKGELDKKTKKMIKRLK